MTRPGRTPSPRDPAGPVQRDRPIRAAGEAGLPRARHPARLADRDRAVRAAHRRSRVPAGLLDPEPHPRPQAGHRLRDDQPATAPSLAPATSRCRSSSASRTRCGPSSSPTRPSSTPPRRRGAGGRPGFGPGRRSSHGSQRYVDQRRQHPRPGRRHEDLSRGCRWRSLARSPWNALLQQFGVSVRSDMAYDLVANEAIPVPSDFGRVLQVYPFFIRAESTRRSTINQDLGARRHHLGQHDRHHEGGARHRHAAASHQRRRRHADRCRPRSTPSRISLRRISDGRLVAVVAAPKGKGTRGRGRQHRLRHRPIRPATRRRTSRSPSTRSTGWRRTRS